MIYGPRPKLFLLYSLISHSSFEPSCTTLQSVYTLFFPSLWGMRNYFVTVLKWQNLPPFSQNFPVNKHPSTSEVINRYRSTYEGCDLVPLITSSIGDSELIIQFQEAYARLFPNCFSKQGIQSNLPSYTPMNQGTICAQVYPEGIQPFKGNNCGRIPIRPSFGI